MKPIRVLQVFAQLDRGGAESMIMTLYRNIDRSQVQFDFVANESDHEYAFTEEIRALGGRIYFVPKYRITNALAYQRAWEKLLAGHPEWTIVHAHHTTPAHIYLNIAKRMVRYTIAHSHRANRDRDLKSMVKVVLRNRLADIADCKFACSEAAGKWMFGDSQYKVLNNAINVSEYVFSSNMRNEVIEEFSLKDSIVIGHIGRFSEQKNHKFLIDIFNEVHKQNVKARLMLVGDGPLRSEIEKKVMGLGLSEAVIFTGVRDDVARLLQGMDVFLFPSLYEGLPVVTIEAQTAGLPCVISDTVSSEVKITDLVEFVSLGGSAEEWAKIVLAKAMLSERRDYCSEVRKAGYDVADSAKWLQDFYEKRIRGTQ